MTKNKIMRYSKVLYSIEYKGRYCSQCNLDGFDNPWLMEYHHVDPTTKEYNVKNKTSTHEFSNIRDELDKCILLCSHCHKTLHSNLEEYNQYKDSILSRLETIKFNNGRATSKVLLSQEHKDYISRELTHKTISEMASSINRSYDTVKSYIFTLNTKAKRSKKSNSLPISEILGLYDMKYSIRTIASQYNVSPDVISKLLLSNNRIIRIKKVIDVDQLKQCIEHKLMNREIAKILDCNYASICRLRHKLNI